MIGERIATYHPLPEGAKGRFDAFDACLREANARIDLTAVRGGEEALYRHYLDSLTALPLLPAGARVIDVGTGAGFPGVPLLLARPDLDMTLLDALKKRADFLAEAARRVPFAANIVHARAEDHARVHREAYDIAVSRAVASLPVLLEWLLPLVRVGGSCILWKGPEATGQLDDAERVAALLGGGNLQLLPAPVPDRDWQHVLITVKKVEKTAPRFPRRAGMALKRPL